MDAQGDSATNVIQVDASDWREPKIVAAAQVHSIDYGPIVENAVARLSDNTPDKRGEVYAQARTVVKRHLQLMQLPEPIIELEELALDVAIGKIERRWRAQGTVERETAEKEVAEEETAEKAIPLDPPKRRIERPAMIASSIVAGLLRKVANPIGVVAALPFIAMVFFLLYADNNVTYRSLVDGLVERWFLDPGGEPGVTAGDDAVDRGPARVVSTAAAVAAKLDAPAAATMAAECDNGPPMSEHNACARDAWGGGTAAEMPKSDAGPPWLASFTALSDITSGRAPSSSPAVPATGDVVARSAAPIDALEPNEAASAMSPDAVPRAAPAQASRTQIIKPVDAKVTALIESGKQAVLKGDLDRAVRDFSEAIRIDPKYPDSYSERGQTLFKLGEIDRAIADYSAALARDPRRSVALRARGMAHLYRGDTDLALADLSKMIALAERDPMLLAPIELFYARRSRGSIYDSKQQYDLEIADCTALIDSYARDPILVDALTANYGSAGAANIMAMIYRQRANAFLRRSKLERAVADLTDAIPLSSDRGYAALIDRSKLHEGLGRNDLAVADAQAALNIRPASEEARLALNRLGAPSRPTPPKGL